MALSLPHLLSHTDSEAAHSRDYPTARIRNKGEDRVIVS